jgi:HSP20 family protein
LRPGISLDIDEDAATYTVTSEMPGLKADNIRVTMDGDMLVIVGEHPEEVIEEKDDNKRTLMRERRYGRYSRRVQLPGGVDIDRAEASYEDGVLTLTLPKSEQTIQKMIPVRASGVKQ